MLQKSSFVYISFTLILVVLVVILSLDKSKKWYGNDEETIK